MHSLLRVVSVVLAVCAVTGRMHGGMQELSRSQLPPKHAVYLGTYGYTQGGVFDIVVKHNRTLTTGGNAGLRTLTNAGFLLQLVAQRNTALLLTDTIVEQDYLCTEYDAKNSSTLANVVRNMKKRQGTVDEYHGSYTVQYSDDAGFYGAYFYNCDSDPIDVSGTITKFNVGNDMFGGGGTIENGGRTYLEVGDWALPLFYLLFVVGYVVATAKWVHVMHKNRAHVFRVHYVMLLLVLLKGTSVLMKLQRTIHFASYGEQNKSADFVYFIVMSAKSIVLFSVILLIGTGWSVVKHGLVERDRIIFVIVIPLQIVVNVALVVLSETSRSDVYWQSWHNTLRALDMVCCFLILLPIMWSMRNIREVVFNSHSDGKNASNILRLRQYHGFYISVVVYIYFTRLIVPMMEMHVGFRGTYLPVVAQEFATFFCMVYVGMCFAPKQRNPYVSVNVDAELADVIEEDMQEQGKSKKAAKKMSSGGVPSRVVHLEDDDGFEMHNDAVEVTEATGVLQGKSSQRTGRLNAAEDD